VLVVEDEIVADTTAITPLGMVDSFIPHAMHDTVPALFPQETVFDAPVAALPAATVTDEKSVVEYVRVHCAAPTPPGEFMDKFNCTVEPGVPEPELRLMVVCPKTKPLKPNPKIDSRASLPDIERVVLN